jgi:hypothetical protein
MDLPTFLTSSPKSVAPLVRLGFLALCAGLLVGHVAWLGRHPWAFHFPWPRLAMVALRIGATLWLLLLGACWFLVAYR